MRDEQRMLAVRKKRMKLEALQKYVSKLSKLLQKKSGQVSFFYLISLNKTLSPWVVDPCKDITKDLKTEIERYKVAVDDLTTKIYDKSVQNACAACKLYALTPAS